MKNKFLTAKKPLMSGILAISMLTAPLSACDDTNLNINSSTPNNSSSQPNTSSSSGPIDPSTVTENDYFKSYSKILQTVIKGSYYKDVIDYEEENYDIHSSTTKDNFCENIPYGFLDDMGYDIDAIKIADNSAVTSEVYIYDDEPNNLYIKCAVLNKSEIDYYDTYLLKYTLDNTELYDLNRLFDMQACGFTYAKKAIYQAPFFIQELSYQKEPEVIAHSYMEATTFNWFKDCIDLEFINSTNAYRFDINKTKSKGVVPILIEKNESYDSTESEATVYTLSFSYNSYKTSSTGGNEMLKFKANCFDNIKIFTKQKKKFGSTFINIDENDILSLSSESNVFVFTNPTTPLIDNTNTQPKSATFYNVHNALLLNGLESNIGKRYVDDESWLFKEMSNNSGSTKQNNNEQ